MWSETLRNVSILSSLHGAMSRRGSRFPATIPSFNPLIAPWSDEPFGQEIRAAFLVVSILSSIRGSMSLYPV